MATRKLVHVIDTDDGGVIRYGAGTTAPKFDGIVIAPGDRVRVYRLRGGTGREIRLRFAKTDRISPNTVVGTYRGTWFSRVEA